MRYIVSILLVSLALFPKQLSSQNKKGTFEIQNVILSESSKRIEAKALILDRYKNRPDLPNRNFTVVEYVDGERERLTIERIKPIDKRAFKKDTFTVLFIVDVSGSMKKDDRINKAKNAVIESVREIEFSPASKIFISTFADEISELIPVSKDDIEEKAEVIRMPPPPKDDTDLYRALDNNIRSINDFPGTKVVILLSDGVDDTKTNLFL